MTAPRSLASASVLAVASCIAAGCSSAAPPPPPVETHAAAPSAVAAITTAAEATTSAPERRPVCKGRLPIGTATFSPDGKRLATACGGGTKGCTDEAGRTSFVDVWDLAQGALAKSLPTSMENISTEWSPGGFLASIANPTTGMCDVRLFSPDTFDLKKQLDFYCVSGFDFDPTGARFAVAGCDGQVAGVDLATANTVERPHAEAHIGGDYDVSVRWANDGKTLFVEDEYLGLQALDPATLKRRGKIPPQPGSRTACSDYSPKRESFAAGSDDGALIVVETKNPTAVRTLVRPSPTPSPQPVSTCVALQWLDAKRFLVGFESGEIHLWSLTGKPSFRSFSPAEGAYAFFEISPSGAYVAARRNEGLLLWDLASGESFKLADPPRNASPSGSSGALRAADPAATLSIDSIQWSPSGDKLAAVVGDRLMAWDSKSRAKLLDTPLDERERVGIEWSPTGAFLALSGVTARLFRLADGASVTLAIADHDGARVGLVGTPSGLYSGPPDLSSCVVPDSVPASRRAQVPGLLANFTSRAPLDAPR